MNISEVFGKNEDVKTYASSPQIVDNTTLVGVEIELENFNTDLISVWPNKFLWETKNDGSLHGPYPIEFCFREPFAGQDIVKALDQFEELVVNNNITPDANDSTSIHVHLDFRPHSIKELLKFAGFYLIFEEPLYKFSSSRFNRRNNFFCVPMSESDHTVGELLLLKRHSYRALNGIARAFKKEFRYSGFNLSSLPQFGSIELRMSESGWKAEPIIRWINILLKLKKFSVNYSGAFSDIPKYFSVVGINKLLEHVFGDFSTYLYYNGVEEDMLESLRQGQRLFETEEVSKRREMLDNLSIFFEGEGALINKFRRLSTNVENDLNKLRGNL
jgi:hypothetical protein